MTARKGLTVTRDSDGGLDAAESLARLCAPEGCPE